jgi:hypothetical protein
MYSRAAEFYGAGDVDKMFNGSPITPTPWAGMRRRKDLKDYDEGLVEHAIRHPDQFPVVGVDPRNLRASQPNVTRAGVSYYMADDYRRTGETYADQHQSGNAVPVVYRRGDEDIILSGHHRAAASLLRGEQFQSRLVEGPWGTPRKAPLRFG